MASSGKPAFHHLQPVILLTLILAGGLFVRIWGVWNYLPGMDEMQFLIISGADSWAEVWRRAHAEIHPPLAWFIRHLLMMLTPDIFLQRLLSAAAGMIAIVGMYRLGTLLMGMSLGLGCATIMAFAPPAVVSSMTLRNYAFLLPFLIWALVFFFRWQQQARARDVAACSSLLFLACATHFSGFLVAAACGMTEGIRLMRNKRWRDFILLCVSCLPLALLSMVLYLNYLAPGMTLPSWEAFMAATGSSPPVIHSLSDFFLWVVSYFFLFIPLVTSHDISASPWSSFFQGTSFAGGVAVMTMYIVGLMEMRKDIPRAFILIAVMWVIALGAALAGVYPFTPGRHNDYLLPFFILPLGYLFRSPLQKLMAAKAGLSVALLLVMSAIAVEEATVWYDLDFALTWPEFTEAQDYLDSHIQPGDAIVTEWLGAYYYLIYAKDAGKTPYDRYGDIAYHGATLLAPSGSPIRPYGSWHPFHDTLMKRIAREHVASPQNQVWFVNYDWKNREIWTLMECGEAAPLMTQFFSRENVLIFSIRADKLSAFLQDTQAWERCYRDYTPLVTGYPFHAVSPPAGLGGITRPLSWAPPSLRPRHRTRRQ